MAWHSKWHNIRHKKAVQDSKKAKIYTKIWKIIQMAAKWWDDPSLNPSLASALEKARYYNLPKDVINRAIQKWAGKINSEDIEEIYYEWYWPWWAALYIKSLSSNKNRSSSEIRATITSFWWSLGEPWSVSWQFEAKSYFIIIWKKEKKLDKWKEIENIKEISYDEVEKTAILSWADDIYEIELNTFKIIWEKNEFQNIMNFLINDNYKIVDSWIEYIPTNKMKINENEIEKLLKLIEELEDNDDVERVFTNVIYD